MLITSQEANTNPNHDETPLHTQEGDHEHTDRQPPAGEAEEEPEPSQACPLLVGTSLTSLSH